MSMYVVEKDKNLQKKGIGAMACAMSSSTAFLVARYTSGREHYLLCLEFPGARMVWKLFKCVSTQSNIFMKSIETRTVSTSQKHLTSPSQNVHILYVHTFKRSGGASIRKIDLSWWRGSEEPTINPGGDARPASMQNRM
jgi:hypothetical protein